MEQLLLEPTISKSNKFERGWMYDCPSQVNSHTSLSAPGAYAGSVPSIAPLTRYRASGETRLTRMEVELVPVKGGPITSSRIDKSTRQSNVDRLARENKDITALYNIGVAVGSSLSLEEIIWRLYKESGRLIDTTNFAIVIYDEQTDTLNFSLVFDDGQKMEPFSLKHSSNQGLTSSVLTTQAPLLVPDLAETKVMVEIDRPYPNKPSQGLRPEVQLEGTARSVRSWLGVPILNPALTDENTQGAIITWSDESNAFTGRDLWLLSAIGTQAAIAIRNARLFEASQCRTAEMAVINDVAHTLASTLNLEEVLTRIMEQVEGTLNVEAGFLLLTDPSTGDLVFQIALGEAQRANQIKPFRLPKGRGIAGQVALTGQPRLVTKKEGQLDFRARNILCVPLVLHGQIIGVLEVINKKEDDFTQHDLELLDSITSFATIAIENARLHESVLSERDRVIEVEEQARKALAHDLHDGPVQLVAGMMMRLDFCQTVLEKDPSLLAKELPRTKTLGEQAVQQMRTVLFELRPLILETEGLEVALQTFLECRQKDITGDQSTRLTLEIETGRSDGHISQQDSKVEAAIFAIVQETVTNALKHAQASNIMVRLKETHTGLHTTITDDGQGFDVDQVMKNYERRGSLGMVNIRERAELIGGELSVESAPGQGTQIKIYVPKAKEERLRKRGKTGRLSLPPELMESKL